MVITFHYIILYLHHIYLFFFTTIITTPFICSHWFPSALYLVSPLLLHLSFEFTLIFLMMCMSGGTCTHECWWSHWGEGIRFPGAAVKGIYEFPDVGTWEHCSIGKALKHRAIYKAFAIPFLFFFPFFLFAFFLYFLLSSLPQWVALELLTRSWRKDYF